MATQPNPTATPPVEVLLSEVVASLALAAHVYLEPAKDKEELPDFAAAELAIDVAGAVYERIQARLSPGERSALGRLLTDLRMTFVRKRGL